MRSSSSALVGVFDGVNVGVDVYRIRTRIGEHGATLEKDPELLVPHRDRRTRSKRYAELDDAEDDQQQ